MYKLEQNINVKLLRAQFSDNRVFIICCSWRESNASTTDHENGHCLFFT